MTLLLHQVGFRLVEALAQQAGISLDKKQHNAVVARGLLWSHRVLLAKPTTFMNLSGQAVSKIVQYYKVCRIQTLVDCQTWCHQAALPDCLQSCWDSRKVFRDGHLWGSELRGWSHACTPKVFFGRITA